MRISSYDYCMDIIESTGKYRVLSYAKNLNDPIFIYDNEINKYYYTQTLFSFYEKVKPVSKNRFNNSIEYQVFLDAKFGPGEFLVLGAYVDTNTPCKIRHKCGHVYSTAPKNLIDKRKTESSCNNCRSMNQISSGEKSIIDILEKENIPYDFQHVFENCRDKKALPFDFAIYTDSTKSTIKAIIEYDGIQHFESVEKWGGDEKLRYTQRHDLIKNNYCYNNNIPLLRITYTVKDYTELVLLSFLEHPVVFEQPLDARDLFKNIDFKNLFKAA